MPGSGSWRSSGSTSMADSVTNPVTDPVADGPATGANGEVGAQPEQHGESLLTVLRRSAKPADARHPFGYGKERYFWSLLAAVSIFTAGALFAIYEGIHTLTGHPEDHRNVLIGYLVLAGSAVLESISLTQAIRQVRGEQAKEDL